MSGPRLDRFILMKKQILPPVEIRHILAMRILGLLGMIPLTAEKAD
jgi:hypothetical protein